MTYHLDIIDKNVDIPNKINKEYNTIEEAFFALDDFVHSFDRKERVDGRVVCTDTCEDVEYCSSVMDDVLLWWEIQTTYKSGYTRTICITAYYEDEMWKKYDKKVNHKLVQCSAIVDCYPT